LWGALASTNNLHQYQYQHQQRHQNIYPLSNTVQLFLGIDLETMPLQFFHELTSFLKKRVNFIV
jgi:hypothetical protein